MFAGLHTYQFKVFGMAYNGTSDLLSKSVLSIDWAIFLCAAKLSNLLPDYHCQIVKDTGEVVADKPLGSLEFVRA